MELKTSKVKKAAQDSVVKKNLTTVFAAKNNKHCFADSQEFGGLKEKKFFIDFYALRFTVKVAEKQKNRLQKSSAVI